MQTTNCDYTDACNESPKNARNASLHLQEQLQTHHTQCGVIDLFLLNCWTHYQVSLLQEPALDSEQIVVVSVHQSQNGWILSSGSRLPWIQGKNCVLIQATATSYIGKLGYCFTTLGMTPEQLMAVPSFPFAKCGCASHAPSLILQGCLAQLTPVYLKGDQNRILIKLSQDTGNFHNQQFSLRQWQLNKEKSGTNDPVGCFPVSTLTPFSIQMKPLYGNWEPCVWCANYKRFPVWKLTRRSRVRDQSWRTVEIRSSLVTNSPNA